MDLTHPFSSPQAHAAGITRQQLRSRRFRRMFRGVYVQADVDLTLAHWLRAAFLVLPGDAVVSHSSAMRLHGFEPRRRGVLEFSTNTSATTTLPGIVLHRRKGHLYPDEVAGFWATGPDRTFVDVAVRTPLPELVAFGDHLVGRGATTIEDLRWYAESRHLDGVRRARRLARLVVSGVDSPRETWLRLGLRFARLPAPEVNGVVNDAAGGFLARGDLVYRRWKVVVEYDGVHHRLDAKQWKHDLRRREVLEAEGWTVIVVTADDFRWPQLIPTRVHAALVAHGYRGPAPVTSTQWSSWFASR